MRLIQNVRLYYELYDNQVRTEVILPLADDDPLALQIIYRELERPVEDADHLGPI